MEDAEVVVTDPDVAIARRDIVEGIEPRVWHPPQLLTTAASIPPRSPP